MRGGWYICVLLAALICGCARLPEPSGAPSPLPYTLSAPDNSPEWVSAQQAFQVAYREHGWNHPATAAALNRMALVHKSRGEAAAAEGLYRQSYAIIRDILGAEHRLAAATMNNLAELYRETHRYEEADDAFRQALEIIERARGASHPDTGRIARNYARLHRDRGHWEHAVVLYNRAVRIARENNAPVPEQVALLRELSTAQRSRGDFAAADLSLNTALALIEDGNFSSLKIDILNSRAMNLIAAGDIDAAARSAELALDMRLEKNGWDHPATANEIRTMAWVFRLQDNYSEAEQLLRKALAIDEIFAGRNSIRVAENLLDLAAVLQELGALREKTALLERALRIMQDNPAADEIVLNDAMRRLAGIYFASRDFAAAESLLLQLAAVYESAGAGESAEMAAVLNNLGLVYTARRRYAEAESLYRRAVEIWENDAGNNRMEVANAWLNLAELFDLRRMPAEARLYRMRAERLLETR